MLTTAAEWLDAAVADSSRVVVNVPAGDPLWQTAAVAIGAALLGSLIGGYSSFRANQALETRRREARAKARRKAKIYTPIRSELLELRDACESGLIFRTWGIVREQPPNLLHPPARLHLWKDLVEDGRALTAASDAIRDLLDEVDRRADACNEQLATTRTIFAERGMALLDAMGETPRIANWVETDTPALLRQEFDDLNILGTSFGDAMKRKRIDAFVGAWKSDERVRTATEGAVAAQAALRRAIDAATRELERAMARIASKYEAESRRD